MAEVMNCNKNMIDNIYVQYGQGSRFDEQRSTGTNHVDMQRVMYQTIISSLDYVETGHKLLKLNLQPRQELDLCKMIIECCGMEINYRPYYGFLAQGFCMIKNVYKEIFEKLFVHQYIIIHQLETNKLCNVAKFFAHLLATDGLPWHVLARIRLTEVDTTSSSHIFIMILFQELCEQLGLRILKERLTDPRMQADFESLFPRDSPRNTRFSIKFFTSIGLGGLADNLRDYLKNTPRLIMQQSESQSEGRGLKRKRPF